MIDFDSWLKREKIQTTEDFLNPRNARMKRSRMSTKTLMSASSAQDMYKQAMIEAESLRKDIMDAVHPKNEQRTVTRSKPPAPQLSRTTDQLMTTSPELDPYQMARQIPGMERKGAMTTVAGGGGGSNVDLMGMGMGEEAGTTPVTTSTPGLTTGETLPAESMTTPTAPDDEYVSGLASGGPLQRGAVHMVGEAGRELVVPRGDGGYQVIPHGTTEAVMARNPQMRVEGHADGDPIPPATIYSDNDIDANAGATLSGLPGRWTPRYDQEFRPWETFKAVVGAEPSLSRTPPQGYLNKPMPVTPEGAAREAARVTSAAPGMSGAGAETDRPDWTPKVGPSMRRVDFSAPLSRSRGVPGVTPLGSRGETEVIGSGYEGQPTPISRRNDAFYQQMGDAADEGAIVEVRYGPNDVKYFNPAEYGPGRPFRSPEAAKRGGEVWEVSGKPQQPTTLIRGTNVTYAAPGSITGEQEFSTPTMAREAQRYTPGVQAEMFGLKQQVAKNVAAGYDPALTRQLMRMNQQESMFTRSQRRLTEKDSIDPMTNLPTRTLDARGNPIAHPDWIDNQVGKASKAFAQAKNLEEGMQIVDSIAPLLRGYSPDYHQKIWAQLLKSQPNLGAAVQQHYLSQRAQQQR